MNCRPFSYLNKDQFPESLTPNHLIEDIMVAIPKMRIQVANYNY